MVQSKESAADIAELKTEMAVMCTNHEHLESTMEDVHDSLAEMSKQVTGLVINYKVFRVIVGLALMVGPGIGVMLAKGFG